jgi:Na+/proline symporter
VHEFQRGLSGGDAAVLIGYLAGITVLGVVVSRRVRTTSGFFLGERKFGKAVMVAQALGTGTHSDQAVGVAGAAYGLGLAGIWYQWMWIFTTPFYWLLAPVFRRLRMVTLADFFEHRYGRLYAIAYTFFSIYLLALWQGIAIKGTTVTVSAITGYPELAIAIVVAFIFTSYGVAGGLVAAAITDFVQGILVIVLSFLLVPFGLNAVGGFAGLHQKLPAGFFHVFSDAGGELSAFNVTMLVISGLIGITAQPHMMAVGGSGKTELNCRIGWTYGNFIKRVCSVGWTLTGVVAAALYPGLPFSERERSFGLAVVGLLPAGLLGLMVASLLATAIATCSAFMVDGSALFVGNFYRRYLVTGRGDSHYLKVARWASFLITAAGFGIGIFMPSVVSATVHFVTILPFVGLSFWVGVIWRRANRYGACASTAGSAMVFSVLRALHYSTAWASLWSLVAGLFLIISVSYWTPPESAGQLARVFRPLDVPVGKEGECGELEWETPEAASR